MIYILIILAVISAMMFTDIVAESAFMLKIRREKLGNGVKIMHISDIHKRGFGANNSRISEIAKRESPDLIFITGDLVSRTSTDFSPSKAMLNELCRVAPVYMIYGNHEQSLPEDKEVEFAEMLRKTDVHLMQNESCTVTVNDRELYIAGVQQKYETYKKNGGYRDLDEFVLPEMTALMGKCSNGEVLLLAHNPKWAEVYEKWGAKYTFSGHVHGGVVRLFGIGILSPERKFLPKYTKGVYEIGKMKLLVSAGLGKLRAFNPPEVVFYEI